MMWTELPPGLILLLGGVIAAVAPHHVRKGLMLVLPFVGFWQLIDVPNGDHAVVTLFGAEMVGSRIDSLSLVWGYIFYIAALVAGIYHLHVRDRMQDVAALTYMGSAIGAVFAGDLITLFIYWELTAVTSVFLIFANRTNASFRAGIRYLIVQIASGVLLLGGLIIHWRATGSVNFGNLGLDAPGAVLIFLGFGIKAAFPLLHNWLQDSYPQATVSGTVFLSSFTTKMAIYTLARGFPGAEELIWIGATMTAFPIFYAVIENDLRKVLAYSLNNQLGYMVVGVGIGTDLALNGAAAHAFTHILYKGLLFMSMGAVLYRVGTIKGSELGGLYKSMPWTTGFCIVGAASISAFPLFSGFISKSLIITAAAEEGYWFVWLILLFASAGVFHHSGIKIPYFAFFAWPHQAQKTCREAPLNMLVAMGIAAFFCIGVGIFPGYLYDILPYQTDFVPYTASHVVTQLQLLLFSALAFAWLMRTGLYPPELKSTVLDFDWIYRKALHRVWRGTVEWGSETSGALTGGMRGWVNAIIGFAGRLGRPDGLIGRTSTPGTGVLWLTAMLGLYLLVFAL
ncbi:MAG: Na(+)/H(+) antiporter subunit D [Minwuia sp.]|nr:Na(+)/H(+) antiporter subunit D [Minwuia sp.]